MDVRDKQEKQQELLPDVNLRDALLEHPIFDGNGRVPIQFSTIYDYEQNDQTATRLLIKKLEGYQYKTLWGFLIICTAEQHSKWS